MKEPQETPTGIIRKLLAWKAVSNEALKRSSTYDTTAFCRLVLKCVGKQQSIQYELYIINNYYFYSIYRYLYKINQCENEIKYYEKKGVNVAYQRSSINHVRLERGGVQKNHEIS